MVSCLKISVKHDENNYDDVTVLGLLCRTIKADN